MKIAVTYNVTIADRANIAQFLGRASGPASHHECRAFLSQHGQLALDRLEETLTRRAIEKAREQSRVEA